MIPTQSSPPRLVLLESPYAYRTENEGECRIGLLRNVTYARQAVRDCLRFGEFAYASHLFYTQPHILDDDIPEERALGIEAGLAWGAKASSSVLYIDLGYSSGMKYGVERARNEGRPISERRLPGWEQALSEEPRDTLLRLGLYDEAVLDLVQFGDPRYAPVLTA